METLIDQIRAALADDAGEDSHRAGAAACRSVLATLDAKCAPSSTSAPAATAPPAPMPRPSVGEMPALVAIRGLPRTQLLDYVINKLRALQPETQTGPAAVASTIAALRNLSLDQIVDLGVARLQTALSPRPARALPEGARIVRLAQPLRSRARE